MNKSIISSSLPNDYDPLKDKIYMSPDMLKFFKDKLTNLLIEIINKENSISSNVRETPYKQPDFVDTGTDEELQYNDFMYQEHEENLRFQIEEALKSIENGTYGFCEESGNPIGIERLLIIPYARFTTEAQEKREKENN
ncbi:MAG: TraR/DksA family transcriptional regulator [Sphingobacteriia bacterium]|nr:TraR/DksA family transcriptional regulator [Sphingobacteriia bacterium]